jgi:CheY-like chemotaxis protein
MSFPARIAVTVVAPDSTGCATPIAGVNANHKACRSMIFIGVLELGRGKAASEVDWLILNFRAVPSSAPFEVAPIDHQMPECDGAELGRRINAADSLLKSTRLVLLTSSGQKSDLTRFEELGFAGFLIKSVAC